MYVIIIIKNNDKSCKNSNLFVRYINETTILKVFLTVKSYFLNEMVAKLYTAAILFGP